MSFRCGYCEKNMEDGEAVIVHGVLLHNECKKFYLNRLNAMASAKMYKCPECEGSGESKEFIDVYPRGLPDSGQFDSRTWETCTCPTCKGYGYTEDEKKPIIGVVGYN